MKIFRNIALGLLAALPFMATGQQTRMLTGDKNNEYGVVYSLPQTELVVDATCEVTVRVPGPYQLYAKRYLGAEAPVKENSSSVRITDMNISTRGVPSKTQYLMQMKPGALANLCVAESGMLLAINTEVSPENKQEQVARQQNTPAPDIDEYLRYVDADYLSSLSSAKRAQLLAQTIMEIRDSRLSLSRGTAETMPADGRQLELMLESLQQQENALMRAFNGYEHTLIRNARFTLLPDSTDTELKTVLFRLSDSTGFCDKEDYSGEPVYLTVKLLNRPQLPLDLKGEPKAMPKNAIVYALPGTADVNLVYKGEILGDSSRVDIAQFGTVFGLDPKLFTDKRKPSSAIFDAATGALVRITEL